MDDDDYGGSRPLSNADFRRMLESSRHGAGRNQEGGEKKKRPKPVKPHKPKPAGEGGAEEPGYRDRAAERRKGISDDFEAVPEDLANILQGGQAGLNKLSYEESKFLGGDIAHTHLVKGLDFALLQKIRAEQEAKKGEEEESEEEEKEGTEAAQQRQEVKFATPLGRAVHAFFFDPKQRSSRADVAQMFLPRRTAFVYELAEPSAPDVPTLLRRSKEDCPKVQETMLGAVDSSMLERMAKIMSYMTLAGGKKKIKKKDKMQLLQGIQAQGDSKQQQPQPGPNVSAALGAGPHGGPSPAVALQRDRNGAAAAPPPPSGAAEEEDDIFADAGRDYVVERKKDKVQGGSAGTGAARYFDRPEDMSDLPPLPAEGPAPPPPPPHGGDDMDLGEDMGPALPSLPPSDEAGPVRPPAGFDYSSAYAEAGAYGAYPDTDAAYAAAGHPAAAAALAAAGGASGSGAALKRDEGALRRRHAGNEGEDAYAECYPSYYEYAGTVVDSDEEEGGDRREGADKGVGLSRFDFGSEEEYREYLAANPQRAAAGGGKGDTRRAKREASKRDNKQQQKIHTQLDKIQKIMEDKGFDHADAFRSSKGGSSGKVGGEAGSAEPAMPTKRRRI